MSPIATLLLLTIAAADAPTVAVLMPQLQGKRPADVRSLIVNQLGPPARDVGSGFQIDQWDVDGGVLTFHPMAGPSFERNGVTTRLIRTNNRAKACLFRAFEMRTLPEGPHGLRYWLGELSLGPSRYWYTDSKQHPDHRAAQANNFFMRHPSGRIRVTWATGVGPDTRLEDLPEASCIATVTFLASESHATEDYRVLAYPSSMSLALHAEGMSFQMDAGWVSYWQ